MINAGARRSVDASSARASQLIAPLRRALQVRGARGDEIVCDGILGIARVARQRLLGGFVLAFGELQQPLAEAAPRTFVTTLLPGSRRQSCRALISAGQQTRTDEIRGDQQQQERDRRHLDQAAGEAQRDVTGIGEQKIGEQRAEDSAAAMYRPPLIVAPSFRTARERAAVVAALAPMPEMSGSCGSMSMGSSCWICSSNACARRARQLEVVAEPLPRAGECRAIRGRVVPRDRRARREQQQLQMLTAQLRFFGGHDAAARSSTLRTTIRFASVLRAMAHARASMPSGKRRSDRSCGARSPGCP